MVRRLMQLFARREPEPYDHEAAADRRKVWWASMTDQERAMYLEYVAGMAQARNPARAAYTAGPCPCCGRLQGGSVLGGVF